MEHTQDERIQRYFRRTAAGMGVAVCAIGASSLASWLFGVEILKYYLPGTVTIKFNTALLFLLLGASLCAAALSASRRASLAARALAGFSALFAGGTAAAYFLGIKNFPLDQLFFREPAGYLYTLTPGRMALETALGLLAAAIALLAADSRRSRAILLREALSGAVFLAGLTVTVGYWFSGHLLIFTSASRTLISLPAGLAFLLLGAGLLLARPDRGLASLAATASASGRLMRLLVPGAIVIPILIRWARVKGETLGLYGTETGMALMVVSTSAAMAAFLYAAMRQAYAQEREKAAKAAQLARSEEELEDLYNNAPCGYHSLDKDGLFVRINDTELAMLGYAREELLGRRKFQEVITAPSLEVFRENFPRFKETGKVTDLEFELVRRDGGTLNVLMSATAIRGPDGAYHHSRSVMFDITERKRLEEEVKRGNTRLAEANKELEAFSYSVSHDLRAPLRGIEGFSKILQEDYGPKLDAEAQRVIGVIRSNTLKMAQLIDDMLAFSRVSRANVNRERVDMTELAREAWRDAAPEEKAGLCSVPALPPAAGDSAMLRQVWSNLFSNAVKFTSKTPAPRIEVGCRTEGGFNVYTVKDNGAGFDPAYAGKLFGIFQRLHTEKEFPGTGVGLALANRVITKHGGWMKAESAAGKGAAFHFALPVISGDGGDK